MTADEAKQALKEGQIWYRKEHDDLLLIIDGDGLVKQYWWVDFGLTVLNIFDEETISEMVYIGDL